MPCYFKNKNAKKLTNQPFFSDLFVKTTSFKVCIFNLRPKFPSISQGPWSMLKKVVDIFFYAKFSWQFAYIETWNKLCCFKRRKHQNERQPMIYSRVFDLIYLKAIVYNQCSHLHKTLGVNIHCSTLNWLNQFSNQSTNHLTNQRTPSQSSRHH